MIKKNRKKQLESWVRQVMFLLNTCLTTMTSVVHIGDSRQYHKRKEIHTTTKTLNFLQKNDNQLYNLLKKTIPSFQTDEVLKESLHMFVTPKKNEQWDSIRCAKKQDYGVYHEPRQRDLLYGGNIHLWVQDIMETSVQFDGDQNNTNLQTFLAIRNTQHQEKKS